MSYDCDYEEYEVAEDPTESTTIKTEEAKITVQVETKILKRSILNELHAELYSSLKSAVLAEAKSEIIPALKQEITNHTHEIVKSMVDDIYKNEKITIGGVWDKNREELTFEQFVKREIKNIIQSGKFKDSKGYSTTFEDYFTKNCVNSEIENFMSNNVDEIRKSINVKLKTLFDQQTKDLLSNTVLNVLMASETYQGIENSVKRLADKN